MKILIISYYYPPFNCIGANRVGKTSKYLKRSGHSVKVVSCVQQLLPEDLNIEIPPEDITYTSWININKPLLTAIGGEIRVSSQGYYAGEGFKAQIVKWGGNVYKICFNFPDGQVGWIFSAYKAGQRIIKRWRPDIIFASGLPISSLIVARLLSSKTGVPWVGELRDLWVDNSYRFMPRWRTFFETKLEKYIFYNARGIVTVSQPLAEVLEEKYKLPVKVITNGFDEEDFLKNNLSEIENKNLSIAYTGMVYEGRQDPSQLFAALKILNENYGVQVRMKFFGRYLHVIHDLAMQYDVIENVEIYDPVSYEESILVQSQADILLLILGFGEGERGVFTGKFFEYLRSQRPILAIGGVDNVAAKVIAKRNAGVISNDCSYIVKQLLEWHYEKKKNGKIADNPKSVYAGFSREEQTMKLDDFFTGCLTSF